MPRNLDKRVEITFPVEDSDLKKEVINIINIQLADTLKAHIMQDDGHYEKIDLRGRERLEAQDYFCKQAMGALKKSNALEVVGESISRVFIPKMKEE